MSDVFRPVPFIARNVGTADEAPRGARPIDLYGEYANPLETRLSWVEDMGPETQPIMVNQTIESALSFLQSQINRLQERLDEQG